MKGPPRTDRIVRQLKGGENTDIYGALLAAIATTGPVTELPYDQLRLLFARCSRAYPPQLHEVTRVLVQMSKIAREQSGGRLDTENDRPRSLTAAAV